MLYMTLRFNITHIVCISMVVCSHRKHRSCFPRTHWWLSEKYYNGGECDIPQAILSCINMSIRHRLQSVINTNGEHKMCRLFAKFWSLDFKTWCCTIVVSGDITLLYLKALYDIHVIYNLYCLFVLLFNYISLEKSGKEMLIDFS